MIMQIMINLLQNFDMAYKTIFFSSSVHESECIYPKFNPSLLFLVFV